MRISSARQRKKQILVIDADRAVREFFEGLFSLMGYCVHSTNGETGQMARLSAGRFDLAFVSCDACDRKETHRLIRSRRGFLRMPVVLLVGRNAKSGDRGGSSSDFDSLMFTPFTLLDAQTEVLRLIGRPAP